MISIKVAIFSNEVGERSISQLQYTQSSCNIIYLIKYSY